MRDHWIHKNIELKATSIFEIAKLIDFYVDDGYSAKDTKRPQYQRMMRDIRQGKVDLILVADLSRLSRNIADFCDLLKDLEKFKAKFLSIKEQFDSSTPAGEMMLFNMINLAQHAIHRYYNHKESGSGKPITCLVRRYRADDIEKTILDHLATDAQDAGYMDNIEEALIVNGQVATESLKKEIQRVEKAIKKTEDEIENVFQFQLKNSLSPSTSNIVNEKLEKLGQTC